MRYPAEWGEFPDVTDPNEPDFPATDACESELKAAGAGPAEGQIFRMKDMNHGSDSSRWW